MYNGLYLGFQGARGLESERDRTDRGHMHSSTTRQVHGTPAGS
jgi:hypothetical protein